MEQLFRKLKQRIEDNDYGIVREFEPLKYHTTIRIGGPARLYVVPHGEEQLAFIMQEIRDLKLPYFILGNGSNIFFGDERHDAVFLHIKDVLNTLEVEGTSIKVGAGYSLVKLTNTLSRQGLSGLEFAGGIPATVGGAIVMNAGAHGHEISSLVERVLILDEYGAFVWLSHNDMEFAYRTSVLSSQKDWIVISVELRMKEGIKVDVLKRMLGNREYRKEMQPLHAPSCGSVYKNPDGFHAGKLIEDAGLKGYRVGDMEISTKHANFIINIGEGTAMDMLQLMQRVEEKVKYDFGVELKREVHYYSGGAYE